MQTDSSKAELGSGGSSSRPGLAFYENRVNRAQEGIELAKSKSQQVQVEAAAELVNAKHQLAAFKRKQKSESVKTETSRKKNERKEDEGHRPHKPKKTGVGGFQFGSVDVQAQEEALRRKEEALAAAAAAAKKAAEEVSAHNKKLAAEAAKAAKKAEKEARKLAAAAEAAAASNKHSSTAMVVVATELPRAQEQQIVAIDENIEKMKEIQREAAKFKQTAHEQKVKADMESEARKEAEKREAEAQRVVAAAKIEIQRIAQAAQESSQQALLVEQQNHGQQLVAARQEAAAEIAAVHADSSIAANDLQDKYDHLMNMMQTEIPRLAAVIKSGQADVARLQEEKQSLVHELQNAANEMKAQEQAMNNYANQIKQDAGQQVAAVRAEMELISSQARSVAAGDAAAVARLLDEIKELRQMVINAKSDKDEINAQLYSMHQALGKEKESHLKHTQAAEAHIAALTRRIAAHGVAVAMPDVKHKPLPPVPAVAKAAARKPLPVIKTKARTGEITVGGRLPRGMAGSASLHKYLHGY